MNRARHILTTALLALTLALCSAPAAAQQGTARRHGELIKRANDFIGRSTPEAQKLFTGRQARSALIALGGVLANTRVDRPLLREMIENRHALQPRSLGVQPYAFQAVKSLARLGDMPGTRDVLVRAAHAKGEGGVRGAIFELVAGAAVKRMGYKLDGLSHQIGRYETDGKVDNGTRLPSLVNMKSVRRHKALPKVLSKAKKQLKLRNGKVDGRPRAQRNPAMLVIGTGPDVKPRKWNWKKMAASVGSDLSVIVVNPRTGRGKLIYRSGMNQNKSSRQRPRIRKASARRSPTRAPRPRATSRRRLR